MAGREFQVISNMDPFDDFIVFKIIEKDKEEYTLKVHHERWSEWGIKEDIYEIGDIFKNLESFEKEFSIEDAIIVEEYE